MSEDKYDGATVLEPNRGYYQVPIATLDFASLVRVKLCLVMNR